MSASHEISIFSQIVVDNTIHTERPYQSSNLIHERFTWDDQGIITIGQDVFISVPHIVPPRAERLVYHLPEGVYRTGAKMTAKSVETVAWGNDNSAIQLTFRDEMPGGGGMNNYFGLYKMFRGIMPISLFSLFSKDQNSAFEEALQLLFAGNNLSLLKLATPAINIIIEGIAGDRIIVRAPQDRDIVVPYQTSNAKMVMVNTVYAWQLAFNALIECMIAPMGGAIACTESLCNRTVLSENDRDYIAQLAQDKLGITSLPNPLSLQSFILDVMMPSSEKIIYLMNDAELAHIAERAISEFDIMYVTGGEPHGIMFSGMIRALKWLRKCQRDVCPEMIVTLGEDGAIFLDSDNDLHYCRVTTDQEMGRSPHGEKKAIGDLFASIILALHYGMEDRGKIAIRGDGNNIIKKSAVPLMLIAASATADAGVYDGIWHVNPKCVDGLIQDKHTHYAFLGPLEEVDIKNWATLVAEVNFNILAKGRIRKDDLKTLDQLVNPKLLSK